MMSTSAPAECPKAWSAAPTAEEEIMRTNSGAGEAKNNNHDPTLRDHEGGKGPARTGLRDGEFDDKPKAPSDNRGARK
jgi:hypothetical protein